MTGSAWIRVAPKSAQRLRRQYVRGAEVMVRISPYDVPRGVRGGYLRDRGVFRIEFKYVDEEPRQTLSQSEPVTLEVGKHSKKLLAIEVQMDKEERLDLIALALDAADDAVRELQHSDSRADLNYKAVDEVLQTVKRDPRFAGAALA